MRTYSRRIGAPLLWRLQHEVHPAPASLPEHGLAVRGLDVLHPIRLRTEHRDEIVLALHGGDHDSGRASAAGYATTDFEGGHEPRRQSEAGPPALQAIDPAANARWAPVAVKEPHERAALSRVGKR